MYNRLNRTLSILLLLFLSFSSQAQFQWEMGSIIGVANYQGDFVEGNAPIFKESNFAFGVFARYNMSFTTAIRGGMVVGKITGNDLNATQAGRKIRGGSFSNVLKEISFSFEWEPLGAKRYLSSAGFKQLISPYGFVGAGIVIMNPKIKYKDGGLDVLQERIRQDENADYFNTRFVIPFGFGVKMDLAELWSMSIELGMRYAFTDYLDGMSIAGTPENNDWYSYTGITVFHRLKNTRTSFQMQSKKHVKK